MLRIKNISKYRKFYKEEVRGSGDLYDENYIGTSHLDPNKEEEKKGWFDIYHGDKEGYSTEADGIKGYLLGLLDMARTGQAVYEFLQNAVDAEGKHFMMYWDKDEDGSNYVIIANNGNTFNFDSIRSILNVGTSTKTADSATIGKFGIGFKLAHRLVGEDNGLDEVVDEYQGPILFSWKNHEYKKLVKNVKIEVDEDLKWSKKIIPRKEGSSEFKKQYLIEDDTPWLFKILLTCFPIMPYEYEDIKKINYKPLDAPLFNQKDLNALGRWIEKRKNIFEEEDYEHGSIFFIRLGKGKETEITDKNLREGVKFSLAILHEINDHNHTNEDKILRKVHLQDDEPIDKPDLKYIKIKIDKNTDFDIYKKVRFDVDADKKLNKDQLNKLKNESDIEVLIGFRPYDKIDNYFDGAPNFYLYFPMSEEVHNYNFIIHSNAFYKGSSRTFLQKGTEELENINERLFDAIIDRIDVKLNKLFETDKRKFLDFYAALLTSGRSLDTSRSWITEGFTKKFDELLKKYIPYKKSNREIDELKFEITDKKEKIFIKSTKIDIDFKEWNIEAKGWFYWNELFTPKAQNKLEIHSYTIAELLSNEGIYKKINEWIGDDDHRRNIVLEEVIKLNRSDNDTNYNDGGLIKVQNNNILELNLFKFTDSTVYSFRSFQKHEQKGYFLIYDNLSEIRDLLRQLGFQLSLQDVNNKFVVYFGNRLGDETQLKGQRNKTKLFSDNANIETLKGLSKTEKFKIMRSFRELNDKDKTQRVSELKLFKNQQEEVHLTKHILKSTDKKWLENYVIHNEEEDKELNAALVSKDVEIYTNIIYIHWKTLFPQINQLQKDKTRVALEDIIIYYQKYAANNTENEKQLLVNIGSDNSTLIPYQGEILEAKKDLIYFDERICNELNEDEYGKLQGFIEEFYGYYLIDDYYVEYTDKQPFKLYKNLLNIDFPKSEKFSKSEVELLLKWCKVINYPLFKNNTIAATPTHFELNQEDRRKQYYSNDNLINNYIENYYSDRFLLVPKNFEAFGVDGLVEDNNLLEVLIDFYTNDNDVQQRKTLIKILSSKDKKLQEQLLRKINFIELNENWTEETEKDNRLYLEFLNNVLSLKDNNQQHLKWVTDKIILVSDKEPINLKQVTKAVDTVSITKNGKTYELFLSQILNKDNKEIIERIRIFAEAVQNYEILVKPNIEKLLKLDGDVDNTDLKTKFLEELEDNQLVNVYQLLYVYFNDLDKDGEEFKVKDKNDDWHDLNTQWFIINDERNNNFYKEAYIINSDYSEFEDYLFPTKKEVIYFSNGGTISQGFKFLEKFGTNGISKEADNQQFFFHLFDCFRNTNSEQRVSYNDFGWEEYIGFNPSSYMLFETKFKDEQLPNYVTTWLEENEPERKLKELFLKYLGVNTTESNICKLREYIIEKKHFFDTNLSNIQILHLKNTLQLLENRENISIVEDKNWIELIHKIQRKVIASGFQCSVLVYQTIGLLKFSLADEVVCYFHNEQHIKVFKNLDYNKNLKEDFINNFSSCILYDFHDVYSKLDNTQWLKLRYDFLPESGNPNEEDWNYYTLWKANQGISLKTHEELIYNLVATRQDKEETLFETNKHWDIHVLKPEKEIHYKANYSLEMLVEKLEKINKTDYTNIITTLKLLINERNEALSKFLSASSRDDKKGKAIKKALQEADKEDKKQECIEELKRLNEEGKRYSFEWFKVYLELLDIFKPLQSSTNKSSISFSSIEAYEIDGKVSKRFLMLKNGFQVLPLNLEHYQNFEIALPFKEQTALEVESVSPRNGQDLLIYCKKEFSKQLLKKLKGLAKIKIEFSPTFDLLAALITAFNERKNLDVWNNIKEALPPMHFIYGPPGTGKTTNLCKRIIEVLETQQKSNDGILDFKVLVLTPTNKAADVLIKRLIKGITIFEEEDNENYQDWKKVTLSFPTDAKVVRLGGATDPELEKENIYVSKLDAIDFDNINVLASTIHRLPYTSIDGTIDEKDHLFNQKWDMIIFDECSMIGLPYIIFGLMALHKFNRNEGTEFYIAGDPKQIPPIFDIYDNEVKTLELEDENIYTIMGLNEFTETQPNWRKDENGNDIDKLHLLDKQFRSVPSIGKLFSQFSYKGKLKHIRIENSQKVLPDTFAKLMKKSILWSDFPTDNSESIYAPKKLLYSSYHIYAAILVFEILKKFIREVKNHDIKDWNIGVIAPYKAQTLIMNKLIDALQLPEGINIVCSTIHGFQGDERDIIFYIVNPSNSSYTHPNSLLAKDYIFNVAISRARDYLWIITPELKHFSSKHLENLRKIGKDNIVASNFNQIEKFLFGKSKYIYNHSFVTGHDTVNLFKNNEKDYFIRHDERAIDIQLKNIYDIEDEID